MFYDKTNEQTTDLTIALRIPAARPSRTSAFRMARLSMLNVTIIYIDETYISSCDLSIKHMKHVFHVASRGKLKEE